MSMNAKQAIEIFGALANAAPKVVKAFRAIKNANGTVSITTTVTEIDFREIMKERQENALADIMDTVDSVEFEVDDAD